jgi:hypothetical protein
VVSSTDSKDAVSTFKHVIEISSCNLLTVAEFVKLLKINNIVMLVLVNILVSLLLGVNGVTQQLPVE